MGPPLMVISKHSSEQSHLTDGIVFQVIFKIMISYKGDAEQQEQGAIDG